MLKRNAPGGFVSENPGEDASRWSFISSIRGLGEAFSRQLPGLSALLGPASGTQTKEQLSRERTKLLLELSSLANRLEKSSSDLGVASLLDGEEGLARMIRDIEISFEERLQIIRNFVEVEEMISTNERRLCGKTLRSVSPQLQTLALEQAQHQVLKMRLKSSLERNQRQIGQIFDILKQVPREVGLLRARAQLESGFLQLSLTEKSLCNLKLSNKVAKLSSSVCELQRNLANKENTIRNMEGILCKLVEERRKPIPPLPPHPPTHPASTRTSQTSERFLQLAQEEKQERQSCERKLRLSRLEEKVQLSRLNDKSLLADRGSDSHTPHIEIDKQLLNENLRNFNLRSNSSRRNSLKAIKSAKTSPRPNQVKHLVGHFGAKPVVSDIGRFARPRSRSRSGSNSRSGSRQESRLESRVGSRSSSATGDPEPNGNAIETSRIDYQVCNLSGERVDRTESNAKSKGGGSASDDQSIIHISEQVEETDNIINAKLNIGKELQVDGGDCFASKKELLVRSASLFRGHPLFLSDSSRNTHLRSMRKNLPL